MKFHRSVLTAAMASLTVMLAAPAAHAGQYSSYVTAYSDYGNGTMRAPVRAAQYGLQVRLPGGAWIYCEKDSLVFRRNRPCSETLRREALDFWETLAEQPSR